MRIAIQGEQGSFHAEAASRLFGNDAELVPCDSFHGVFEALRNHAADAGVVAVENSLYGSLHETYDLIVRHHTPITAELSLEIHQQLIAFAEAQPEDIVEIYSHPAALDQCRNYLETHFPQAELVEYFDTAAAVAYIKENDYRTAAAIASSSAARLHSMTVLAANIEDEAENITRFVALKLEPEQVTDANKASLILVTSHQPGALYDALGVFKAHGANLTKLESRPVRGEAFKYQFIVDAETDETTLARITDELYAQHCSVTLLGHYRASR